MTQQNALILSGGWDGHDPEGFSQLFSQMLAKEGITPVAHQDLGILMYPEELKKIQLIIPNCTMGKLDGEMEKNLLEAITQGTGLAGIHGGMGDAFREAADYQYMVGGQFVAHPGGILDEFTVKIADRYHPITKGMENFILKKTERYYMHVDPSNQVLATTPMESGHQMPVSWVRTFGQGRVFYASYGHQVQDLADENARELVRRGFLWACKNNNKDSE
jgi:uncharacterized protein